MDSSNCVSEPFACSPLLLAPTYKGNPKPMYMFIMTSLAETKWPDQLPGTNWEYGADLKKVRELADFWQNGYDWRAQEAKINRFDQFTTGIECIRFSYFDREESSFYRIQLGRRFAWLLGSGPERSAKTFTPDGT